MEAVAAAGSKAAAVAAWAIRVAPKGSAVTTRAGGLAADGAAVAMEVWTGSARVVVAAAAAAMGVEGSAEAAGGTVPGREANGTGAVVARGRESLETVAAAETVTAAARVFRARAFGSTWEEVEMKVKV